MKIQSALMVVAGVLTSCALGDTIYFSPKVQNADGTYSLTNDLNWVGGRAPSASDEQVFAPEGELNLRVDWRPSGYNYLGTMKFMSGSVSLSGSGILYANGSPTSVVYVASGVTVTSSCKIENWSKNKPFAKTGGGTFSFSKLGDSQPMVIDVQEGTLKGTAANAVCATKLRIRGGATFWAGSYNFFSTQDPDVQVDKDGVFRVQGGSGKVNVGCLSGEGMVCDNNYETDLQIKPTRDCVFSGTMNERVYVHIMTGATGRFILGNANVLAQCEKVTGSRWLGFLPDVGESFDLGPAYKADSGYPLHLADTNGAPVSVLVRLPAENVATFATDGPGDLVFVSGNNALVGARIQNTGALVNRSSGTMTLGDGQAANDFDFSQLGKLESAAGTIVIRNSGTSEVGASVVGAGALNVASPTVFSDFRLDGKVNVGADMTIADGKVSTDLVTFTAEGKTLTMAGGVLNYGSDPTIGSGVTAAGLCLDGGEVRFHFDSAGTKRIFGTSDLPLSVSAGARGGSLRLTTEMSSSRSSDLLYGCAVYVQKSFSSAVTGGVDGGLSLFGYPEYRYTVPQAITGPFEAEGGVLTVYAGSGDLGSNGFFGRGELVLRNEKLLVWQRANPETVRLTDANRALRVEGGVMITLRDDSSKAAVSAEMSELSIPVGGALTLDDRGGRIGSAGGATVKVTDGTVSVSPDSGRVLLPVFGTTDRGHSFYFLGYDASSGFVPLSSVVNQATFEGTTSATVLEFKQISGAWYQTPENEDYAVEALLMKGQMAMRLGANSKLTIGDGVNVGVLAFEQTSQVLGLSGSGVQFGSAPGLLLVGARNSQMDSHCTMSVPILSANGLSIIGVPDNESFHAISISGASTYAGDTRIGSVCVNAGSASCFSSGDVYVLPGDRHGGQVRFSAASVWNNAFHVAGRGIRHSEYDGQQGNGALSFAANATVAGDVELTGLTRFCTTAADVSGKITGAVSGDSLEIVYSPGVIELDGANSYTGGTRVVKGTLALGCGEAAGSGAVSLDQGTLRFVNTEPIVFANEVSGAGRIEICGAPVTFTGKAFGALKFKTLACGSVIDFPDFDAATVKAAAVLSGAVLDLSGADMTFGEIWGTGRIVGGTVTVDGAIRPGGNGAIGTIAFDRPPLIRAGSTFFCEDQEGACDSLTVEGGDLSVGNLGLAFSLIGESRGKGSARIIAVADGALVGEFASVTKTPQKAERTVVEYGASAVDMLLSQGLMLIFR